MPSPAERGDATLFRERTALAWQRSALSFAAIAGVTVGAAAHERRAWLVAPAAVLLVFALLVWRHARVAGPLPQARALRLGTAAPTAPPRRPPPAVVVQARGC